MFFAEGFRQWNMINRHDVWPRPACARCQTFKVMFPGRVRSACPDGGDDPGQIWILKGCNTKQNSNERGYFMHYHALYISIHVYCNVVPQWAQSGSEVGL